MPRAADTHDPNATNHRFAQPTVYATQCRDHFGPIDRLPFAFKNQNDALTGTIDAILTRPRFGGPGPRVMHLQSSALGELVYIAPGSNAWELRKGTSEAAAGWRLAGHLTDETWTIDPTPIGYGSARQVLATTLTDMQRGYSSVYLRHAFDVAPGELPQSLLLNHNVDDGFVAWINGTEVARVRAAGVQSFDSTADDFQFPEGEWDEIVIPANAVSEGRNVLAVMAVNDDLAGSDFGLDFELVRLASDEADAVADDSIFTVTLPAQANRSLVRYRIIVTDTLGASMRAPFADDPSLNFACFVYNGVPDYVTTTATYPAADLTTLPVYHLIARNGDIATCRGYDPADRLFPTGEGKSTYNWEGAMFYDGVVYDHIRFRLRGGSGRYQLAGKRAWKFRFNKGHYFDLRKQDGTRYKNKARVVETSKMHSNRDVGNFGLVESIDTELWRLIGLPAPYTHWFHWRVIDDAEEAPDQYGGDFWGMSLVIERYDRRFLDEHDLPRGNFYKLIDLNNDYADLQRYQSCETGAPMNFEDMAGTRSEFIASRSEQWIRDHANLEMYYRFAAVREAVRHYDFPCPGCKNMAWYFEANYGPQNDFRGSLMIMPHDYDDTWGPVWDYRNETVMNAVANKPEIRKEERNVVRAFRDLVWQRNQIDLLIDRLAATISGFTPADGARWSNAPGSEGRENWGPIEAKVADMKRFAWVGGSWPGGTVGSGGRAAFLDAYANDNAIPGTPTITYSGEAGFPVDGLALSSSDYADPQSAATFGAMEWRIAEITPLVGDTIEILPRGASWRYLDEGSDQETVWSLPGFNDSTWQVGEGPFGYGFITNTTFNTVLGFGPDDDNRHITTYFRTTIDINDPAAIESLVLQLNVDDGAVDYLNGIEVARDGMPDGVISFQTPSRDLGNEGVYDELEIDASALVAGTNVVAVELHQEAPDSSDLGFDLGIQAIRSPVPPGEDPKYEWNAGWESGVLASFQPAITIPTSAVRPNRRHRARVRHMDNTGRWSHWSAPVEFTATAPDTSLWEDGLVVSEFMYNPPAASNAELSAGFERQDFEWVEVKNIAGVPIPLTEVRFTQGIDFDFDGADVTLLAPGAFTLVVRNRAAFELRYGNGLPVAGEYLNNEEGALGNGGERLKLSYGAGIPIRDFVYGDLPPWPGAADGEGASLELINPGSNPDHALAANWKASTVVGGSPGQTSPGHTFQSWAATVFSPPELDDLAISGPGANPDQDTYSNLAEFVLGGDPWRPDSGLTWVVVEDGEPLFKFRKRDDISGIVYHVQHSDDLQSWLLGPPSIVPLGESPNGDGTSTVSVGLAFEDTDHYFRLLIEME